MENWSVLIVTQSTFLAAIIIKSLCYLICAIFVLRAIPSSSLRKFLTLYINAETITHVAWRLASLISLIIGYYVLIFYGSHYEDKTISTFYQSEKVILVVWASCLGIILLRSSWQGIVELATVNATILQLKKIIRTKKALNVLKKTATAFAVLSPVVGLKWAAFSGLSGKFMAGSQLVKLSEQWLDQRIHGQVKQFVAATLLIAVVESLFKLAVIGLALFLVANLD